MSRPDTTPQNAEEARKQAEIDQRQGKQPSNTDGWNPAAADAYNSSMNKK